MSPGAPPSMSHYSPAPGNALPTAADILGTCFPSFRVRQPEVKTARQVLSSMMTNSPLTFPEIAKQLNALSHELRRSTNPSERRALLRKFRVLLDQADALSNGEMEAAES